MNMLSRQLARRFPRAAARPAAFGLGLWGLLASAAALDFQLHSTEIVDDGITKTQHYFQGDESTRIYITLPRNWTYTDTAPSITIVSPGTTGNTIRLEKSPFPPSLPFKDAGLTAYQKQALALVPSGATAVQMVVQHEDPLPIMHWTSHEFILSYEFFGQACRKSILFLDLNSKEQVVLTSTAPRAAFDATRETGFDVLRSWLPTPGRQNASL